MSEGLLKLYNWVLERLKKAQSEVLDKSGEYGRLHSAGQVEAYHRVCEKLSDIMKEEESI